MLEPTIWAEIDTNAIRNNICELKRITKPEANFMAVVKADGYGHGAVEISRIALDCGADMLGVARIGEAISLREKGIDCPILIFGYTIPANTCDLIHYNLTQTVYDLASAKEYSALAAPRTLKMHLKIDTGMGRLGLFHHPDLGRSAVEEAAAIAGLPYLLVEGVYTHFAASDTSDKTYAELQFNRFRNLLDSLEKRGVSLGIRHAANSGAIIDMPQTHLDMVRAGIAMYGLNPSMEVNLSKVKLLPAMSVKAVVAHVKSVPKGARISYGMTYEAKGVETIASIPVGYADGYNRLFSNMGHMLVRGQKAPVAGRVCMDQTMLNVTGINGVEKGEKVVIMGKDGVNTISADDLAQKLGTINYEIVTSVMARVPRVFL